jgi:hypothetical protein
MGRMSRLKSTTAPVAQELEHTEKTSAAQPTDFKYEWQISMEKSSEAEESGTIPYAMKQPYLSCFRYNTWMRS